MSERKENEFWSVCPICKNKIQASQPIPVLFNPQEGLLSQRRQNETLTPSPETLGQSESGAQNGT